MRVIGWTMVGWVIAVLGCGGAVKKDVAKAPQKAMVAASTDDLLAEIQLRDLEATWDRFGAEMGLHESLWKRMVSVLHNENIITTFSTFDSRGPVAAVAVGTFDKPHFVGGFHLKDPALLSTLLQHSL